MQDSSDSLLCATQLVERIVRVLFVDLDALV